MINTFEIVKTFSLKSDVRLNCSKADLIDLRRKTEDFQWMKENQKGKEM